VYTAASAAQGFVLTGDSAIENNQSQFPCGRPSSQPLDAFGESAIRVRCMKRLTEDDIREIQQIHSRWIEFEVSGEDRRLLTLCADDIEFWPPDAPPAVGRTAVSAQLARGSTRIHSIEISGRRILGSNEIAYLTATLQDYGFLGGRLHP